MRKNKFFSIVLLTGIWLILSESFSLLSLGLGLVFSGAAVYLCHKFLPFPPIRGLNLFRLALYPFFLITQVYLAGLQVIKLIIMGARADIIATETAFQSDFLQVMLGLSITLTPGSILLKLNDQKLTFLWLSGTHDPVSPLERSRAVKEPLEAKLQKVQEETKKC